MKRFKLWFIAFIASFNLVCAFRVAQIPTVISASAHVAAVLLQLAVTVIEK